MTTALLVISFGTTKPEACASAIAPVEQAIENAFPDFPFYRAFTSATVRSRLERQYGWKVADVEQALDQIRNDGFDRVLVQPTLVIPGGEYQQLRAQLQHWGQGLTLLLGEPLLSCEGDLDRLVGILAEVHPPEEDTGLLFMGHGTDSSASCLYEALDRKLRPHSMALCTADSFSEGIAAMKSLGVGNVTLIPLLLTAGSHAVRDMGGTLRALLEAEGFSVNVLLRGLGALPAVRQMYVEKARRAAVSPAQF